MKELTIKISDYLTDKRITEIAEEEIRRSFQQQIMRERDLERVLANTCYAFAYKILDEEWKARGNDFTTELKAMIEKVLNDESTMRFVMFRGGDYGHPKSEAYKILEEESRNARPLIKECVEKHIKEYPFHELDRDEIGDVVYNVIMDKLFEMSVNA